MQDEMKKGPDAGGRDSSEAVEAAERFFSRLQQSGNLPPELSPVAAATAVLCTLSLRLAGSVARDHLIQALPTSLRTLFTRCVGYRRDDPVSMDLPGFLGRVAEHLDVSESDARRIALTVFASIQDELRAAQVVEVAGQLPNDLRTLWPSHPRAA